MIAMTIGLRVFMVVRAFGPGHYELSMATMAALVADISPKLAAEEVDPVEILEALAWLDSTDEAMAKETGSARTFVFLSMKQIGDGTSVSWHEADRKWHGSDYSRVVAVFERENPSLGSRFMADLFGSEYPTVVGETVL
jgi:hypothetical protein